MKQIFIYNFCTQSKKYLLKLLFIFPVMILLFSSCVDQQGLGIFSHQVDVGNPKIKGASVYDKESGEYHLSGAGENIWSERDEFHFLYKKIEGDFILRARIKFIDEGVNAHRKIGIMVREDLDESSAHINAVVHGDGLTSLQFRKQKDAETEEVQSHNIGPNIIQLERKGNLFILSAAVEGETFTTIQVDDLNLNDNAFVGLFICSHDVEVVEKAVFDNVRLIIPAQEDFTPYRDFIGSHIEIRNVETGKRRIVHSSSLSLQAPNWSPDGKSLIYNCEGKIYSLDILSNKTSEINTDFAINNNNDHVLSFDGKWMGISDHTEHPEGQSLVYILPASGGVPEIITHEGPSYLHGFSPDGEYMVYTAGRDNAEHLDIYKVSISTKVEERLTTSQGLDDGSEFSPDGKYIYFNSTRTGTMQIWRMLPDGSNQEQLTFDEYNDWFPHVSPDGKWLVFISYNKEIAADDHPFYKQVYIRIMPTSGGDPKVIGYVYGGQGSMNVYSWSPDSKEISFVSNSVITE